MWRGSKVCNVRVILYVTKIKILYHYVILYAVYDILVNSDITYL